jgi:hypothetical protein
MKFTTTKTFNTFCLQCKLFILQKVAFIRLATLFIKKKKKKKTIFTIFFEKISSLRFLILAKIYIHVFKICILAALSYVV